MRSSVQENSIFGGRKDVKEWEKVGGQKMARERGGRSANDGMMKSGDDGERVDSR